jgi:hypothetical protein
MVKMALLALLALQVQLEFRALLVLPVLLVQLVPLV